MKALLDMDGLIVDWFPAAAKLHGRTFDPTAHWDLFGMAPEEFFAPMDIDWWANIPILPWAFQVIDMLKDCDWCVCTMPFDSRSEVGKGIWLSKYKVRGTIPAKFTQDKAQYATEDTLLIDDYGVNIKAFSNAGGQTFHFKGKESLDALRECILVTEHKFPSRVKSEC